ncbi:hypothetical protein CMK14_21310, partial [Candidatus Poribacteria bacterium]|nr:hypothetical protein [Candidatus Poribacteria bacterium]
MEVTIDQALEIALNHYQQNELQQATEICQKVIEVATKNASAHHLLGLISLRRNNFGVARKLVHQALQLAPKDSDAHNSFGLILEKLGLLRRSALWFQKASFLNSNDASIVHNLANVLQSLGYQEAEQLSQHAMRINPNVANLRLQALGLDKTDISQDAFELQYQLALGNELADNGQHASAVSHYQRVLGKQETIFFFSPDISVSPHFAAQCILGRTLQELGYQVVFLLCPELFYPFMVTDFSPDLSQLESLMQPEPTNLFREYYLGKAKLTLLNYGIAFVDLSSFIDHPVSTTVDGYMSRLPVDLREFEALNTKFGHLTCSDVILAIKDGSPEKRGPQVRQLWLKYIESAMFSFLAIEKVCRMFSVACLIHYNDYSPMLSARLAAKQSGVSVKLLTQASHKNVARSKIILLSAPWQVAEYESMDANLWDKWKQLSLKSHQVEEGANDIIHRLTGRGSHLYSPAKRLEAVELTEQLGLNQQKKTLVAFTSSLDENFAGKSLLKGMGFHRVHPEQPFEDQIDWLSSLTRYVECSDALQLVVRIHPREGKNERESFSSRHLEILKDTFDRPFKSCRFVWPQDDISSYDLAEIADVALTSWSSMGAELARLGIPVLTST